jgi:hypothetical protein
MEVWIDAARGITVAAAVAAAAAAAAAAVAAAAATLLPARTATIHTIAPHTIVPQTVSAVQHIKSIVHMSFALFVTGEVATRRHVWIGAQRTDLRHTIIATASDIR